MTLHHCHTELDGCIVFQLWIVLQNIVCLAIGYSLDDAWNEQQQGPQKNVNGFQKLGCQNTAIILETIKHLFNLEGSAGTLEIKKRHIETVSQRNKSQQ